MEDYINPESSFNLIYHSDNRTINHHFKEEYLSDILMSIGDFLRGCGFVINGNLEVVEEKKHQADEFILTTPYDDPLFDYDEYFVEK